MSQRVTIAVTKVLTTLYTISDIHFLSCLMKGCFYLQRQFAYIGHTMIALLKERHRINEFCGYVLLRSSFKFLQKQKEISYTALLLEDDILARHKNEKIDYEYLTHLEKEYGIPNLWPFIMPDRVIRYNLYLRAYPNDVSLYTHEEMVKMVQVTARAIIEFFEKEKPDFIVFSVVGNLSSMLLYHIAKKNGIRTFLFEGPRIGIKYLLTERYDRSTFLEQTFKKIRKIAQPEQKPLRMEARKFLSDFQRAPRYFLQDASAAEIVTTNFDVRRLRYFKFLLPHRLFRSIHWTLRAVLKYLCNTHKDDYIIMKPWHEFIDKIKRKTRILWGYGDLYDNPIPGEDFAYFALHAEPEAYPMVLAPFYIDQLWLAKQIARSLPLSYKLYVKDHPVMMGLRSRSYYKELKKIPNIRFIDTSVSSLALIQKSKLTLTITGTTGWEAALLKKPVIIFGAMYYDTLAGVKKCLNIQDLPFLIKQQLESFSYDEGELLDLISAALEESVDVDFIQMWDIEGGVDLKKNRERLVPLVDLLAKKLFTNERKLS